MSKLHALRFREMVALFLKTKGHSNATAKPDRAGRISVALREEDDLGDVWGLPNWCLNTRYASQGRDLSGALDEAQADAQRDSKAHAAVAFYRPGRGAGETYVVCTLQDWADSLVRRDAAS
jgi:hypothetical protein